MRVGAVGLHDELAVGPEEVDRVAEQRDVHQRARQVEAGDEGEEDVLRLAAGGLGAGVGEAGGGPGAGTGPRRGGRETPGGGGSPPPGGGGRGPRGGGRRGGGGGAAPP